MKFRLLSRSSVATGLALGCVIALAVPASAYYASYLNPNTDYAYTRDVYGQWVAVMVQIYYVAPGGGWAGWSSAKWGYDSTDLVQLSTTGNMDQSYHSASDI